ncbi:hypothetical protein [Pedobacter immunditicola]|uniref:hypothetical protein n=1 Tax=Pedobacter immunditicola TaxID=3133440 RepID=UPI00309A09C0
MLKYFITVVMCLGMIVCKAQVEQLTDLEICISKTTTHVSDSLVNAGWKLDPALTGNYESDYYRTFSFGNLETDPKKAMAWLRIHTERTAVNRVYYQAPDEETFNRFQQEIEVRKIVKNSPQTIEGQTMTAYVGKDFAYQTIVSNGNFTVVVIGKRYYADHTR